MAVYFFDSSAIIKRYVREVGTTWVTNLLDPTARHYIFVASITGAEVTAAIARQRRGGKLPPPTATNVFVQFRHDYYRQYQVIDITSSVVNRAMQMAEVHALRGYDAVQLATVWELHTNRRRLSLPSLTLVSADSELNAAAGLEGLAVDDPNLHP